MAFENFALKSREDVIRFEKLLNDYIISKTHLSPSHISLINAYDTLQSRKDSGRVFTALLDIQLCFFLLHMDLHAAGSAWTNHFTNLEANDSSVLDSADKFFGKMEIHRFNTSYVLRYRAIWDKLMGLIILLYAPDEYDSFAGSKSKKRTFNRIAKKSGFADDAALEYLTTLLSKFDNSFRTSEAHGTGVLRKYSFSMKPMIENPQLELSVFWNALNQFILAISKVFNKEENQ